MSALQTMELLPPWSLRNSCKRRVIRTDKGSPQSQAKGRP